MKKKALCIIMIAVLVAAIAAVIVIKNKSFRKDKVQEYSDIEQAMEAADFNMDYTDHLTWKSSSDDLAGSNEFERIR